MDLAEYGRFLARLTSAGFDPACVPLGPDKRPLVLWRDSAWSAGRRWDPRVQPHWTAEPVEGMGLLTGARSRNPSTGLSLVVLDVDQKSGVDGFATLADLELRHGTIPATLTVRSPSGSLHLYLSSAARFKTQAGQVGPGLDVRGEGGLVVCPGSWHSKRGDFYRMED